MARIVEFLSQTQFDRLGFPLKVNIPLFLSVSAHLTLKHLQFLSPMDDFINVDARYAHPEGTASVGRVAPEVKLYSPISANPRGSELALEHPDQDKSVSDDVGSDRLQWSSGNNSENDESMLRAKQVFDNLSLESEHNYEGDFASMLLASNQEADSSHAKINGNDQAIPKEGTKAINSKPSLNAIQRNQETNPADRQLQRHEHQSKECGRRAKKGCQEAGLGTGCERRIEDECDIDVEDESQPSSHACTNVQSHKVLQVKTMANVMAHFGDRKNELKGNLSSRQQQDRPLNHLRRNTLTFQLPLPSDLSPSTRIRLDPTLAATQTLSYRASDEATNNLGEGERSAVVGGLTHYQSSIPRVQLVKTYNEVLSRPYCTSHSRQHKDIHENPQANHNIAKVPLHDPKQNPGSHSARECSPSSKDLFPKGSRQRRREDSGHLGIPFQRDIKRTDMTQANRNERQLQRRRRLTNSPAPGPSDPSRTCSVRKLQTRLWKKTTDVDIVLPDSLFASS